MKSTGKYSAVAMAGLRILLGLIFISHAAARMLYGSVGDFGAFLSAEGFPLGSLLAWGITLFECFGGSLLIAGKLVPSVAAGFILHQVFGILLVHLQHGLFVVGHGRNGVEYSVLLIAALLAVGLDSLR